MSLFEQTVLHLKNLSSRILFHLLYIIVQCCNGTTQSEESYNIQLNSIIAIVDLFYRYRAFLTDKQYFLLILEHDYSKRTT